MKSTRPYSKSTQAWKCLLVAAILAGVDARGAPPDSRAESDREPEFGSRLLGFFKRIGEHDGERPRRRANAAAKQQNEPASLDQQPRVETASTGKRKVNRNENANEDRQPPQDLIAARRKLADLKRQVAAVEQELARVNDNAQVPSLSAPDSNKLSEDYELILTPSPTQTLPPRPVTPKVPEPPKRSFAGESPVTTSTLRTAPGAVEAQTSKPASDATQEVENPAGVPTATKTATAGLVKSPHTPHNEIDVSGLPSGTLAKDPTTQKLFRVP